MINKKPIIKLGIFTFLFIIIITTGVLAAQCNDGIDNDLDGNIDFPSDTGCDNENDNKESLLLGYAHACFSDGDFIEDVFGKITFECGSTQCLACILMTESGNYTTSFSKCNTVPQCSFTSENGGSSSGGGGGTSVDVTPPVLTFNSPIQGEVYDSKKIFLDFDVDERADIFYKDLNDNRNRWIRVCDNCRSYSRNKNFKEGLNELRFRATDDNGNQAFFDISFTIDSKSPRISKTSPTRGFIGSILTVEIQEANPVSLVLNYGNNIIEFREASLDLINDCNIDPRNPSKRTCDINVNLHDYDGQEIEYWFVLVDIAGSSTESRHYTLTVDETFPVINNPNSFYNIDGKYLYYYLDITELNLDEVGYYNNNDPKLREKRICSRLKDGKCEGKISLREGLYELTFYVDDKAGHRAFVNTQEFLLDSKKPKISKITPSRGFASGKFGVEFTELNPKTLILYYGTDEDNPSFKNLNIANDCTPNRGKYKCNTNVNIDSFNGQEITYWFTLEDLGGNSVESKHIDLNVDTTDPVLNNPDEFLEVDGSNVFFSFDITEENFDVVSYSYLDSRGRLREKRLCSRLRDGICEKKVRFRDGEYNLIIQITDDAENGVEISVDFEIIR